MRKLILNSSIYCSIVIIFSSCEKVILVDLNSTDPKIVIEAEIADQSYCTVKLSQTVNFDQPNVFPAVTGATIKLSDNLGNTETLIEASAGNYIGATLSGVPGRIYNIEITTNGKTYKASSTMPQALNIDTLIIEDYTGHISGKVVNAKYTDPLNTVNFNRFLLFVNSVNKGLVVINDDRILNGEVISQPIPAPSEQIIKLNTGDTVLVYLQTIDEGAYEYFRTLKQLIGGGHSGPAPANPRSNIDNGALGYFSAYSVKSKSIVIQ